MRRRGCRLAAGGEHHRENDRPPARESLTDKASHVGRTEANFGMIGNWRRLCRIGRL